MKGYSTNTSAIRCLRHMSVPPLRAETYLTMAPTPASLAIRRYFANDAPQWGTRCCKDFIAASVCQHAGCSQSLAQLTSSSPAGPSLQQPCLWFSPFCNKTGSYGAVTQTQLTLRGDALGCQRLWECTAGRVFCRGWHGVEWQWKGRPAQQSVPPAITRLGWKQFCSLIFWQ